MTTSDVLIDAVRVALLMFDPDQLHPNEDGSISICTPSERKVWSALGFDNDVHGWHVMSVDGREAVWQEVFCPYDCKKAAFFMRYGSMPFRPHENPDEQLERVSAAVDQWRNSA